MHVGPWIRGACLVGAVTAVGCGGSKEPPAEQQVPVFKPVDPATLGGPDAGAPLGVPPASTALGNQPAAMVSDMASGWPVALRMGQQMTARLAADRAAGGRWSLRVGSDGGIVMREGEPAYEPSQKGGVEVFTLKAVKPGSTTLTFDYKQGSAADALRSVSYPVWFNSGLDDPGPDPRPGVRRRGVRDLVFHGLPRLPRRRAALTAFHANHGGGTVITAVAAARLGARVRVVSGLADEAVRRLKAEGVRVQNLKRAAEPHAVSVALSTRHERAFATFDGVNDELEARVLAEFRRRIPLATHVHMALGPRDLPAWLPVLTRLRASGVTTSWDFGWHEELRGRPGFEALLGALDWVFVNEREARLYTGAPTLRRPLGAEGSRANVVVSRARVAPRPDRWRHRPGGRPKVRVVDTTGAGDGPTRFLAALGWGSAEACLRAGVRVGSLSTRAAGGIDALPRRAETGNRRPS
jgi:sugar/nucleoside kinase (ribokinase family)/predicted secreted protein